METRHSAPSFGVLLRRYRVEAGLTQEDLAERAGLSVRGVSDLEREVNKTPYRASIQQLIEGLELSREEAATLEAAIPQRRRGARPSAENGREGPRHPSSLPLLLTAFVGREREVAEISRLLRKEGVRLLTLLGPGGTGKTRLALQAASSLLEAYPDGVYFVDLAPLTDHSLVASTIASVLGIKEVGSQPLLETLQHALKDKVLLLVLDNFEHVLEARGLVSGILAICPSIKVLATSRSVLHLAGEREYLVPPLALPQLESLHDLTQLTQYDAVALFIERARAVKPEFRVTNENAPAVAEICTRLDGLPLAIELAAARIRLFPPQALLGRLSQRLTLLTGGAKDLPGRQQTLRGAIDWSYALLFEEEQTLFARLSVFAGGWSYEAAEAVCGEEGADMLEGLEALVEQSLVQQVEGEEGEPRFGMLETIREYAAEQHNRSAEAESTRRRHRDWYLALAEQGEKELHGPAQASWLRRMQWERENFRAALEWSSATAGEELASLRLAAGLHRFWLNTGATREGLYWYERLLAPAPEIPIPLRALALNRAGNLANVSGQYDRAATFYAQSMDLFDRVGDRLQRATVTNNLAVLREWQGEGDEAVRLLEEALAIYRELHDEVGIARVANNFATLLPSRGREEEAWNLLEEALAIYRSMEDTRSIAGCLLNLGMLSRFRHDHVRAVEQFSEGLAIMTDLGEVSGTIEGLEGVALSLAALGEHLPALRAFAVAERMRKERGIPIPISEQGQRDETLTMLRRDLGEQRFETVWDESREMDAKRAIALTLQAGREVDRRGS